MSKRETRYCPACNCIHYLSNEMAMVNNAIVCAKTHIPLTNDETHISHHRYQQSKFFEAYGIDDLTRLHTYCSGLDIVCQAGLPTQKSDGIDRQVLHEQLMAFQYLLLRVIKERTGVE